MLFDEKDIDWGLYNTKQKDFIEDGLTRGFDVSWYFNDKLTWNQLSQIRDGLILNLDVSIYAKPEFGPQEMYEIRKGLTKGVDVLTYAKTEFNYRQMEQIRIGLQDDLDISVCLNPNFTCEQMKLIRYLLLNNLDIQDEYSFAIKNVYSFSKANLLFEGFVKKIDIKKYSNEKLSERQMREIKKGLEDGYDLTSYVNKNFNGKQLTYIRKGLEDNMALEDVISVKDSYKKIRDIIEGKISSENFNLKNEEKYRENQLKQLRLGYLQELDISIYENEDIPAEDMLNIR